ncbi:MAG: SurA N-terminal domain-containing protein [Muribaculaceae bacterium]|nr:SurA N-terminal domain-containing protein [Muribaculaceae bacterium]
MAVLEKIRRRSAILAIVIGLGLLAFIGEEAAKAMGFLGKDTSMLTVGDEKISPQEFSAEQDRLQKKNQNQNQKDDPAVMRQQVAQQIISDRIVSQECEEAGIYATDEEILSILFKETGLDNKTFEQIKNSRPDPNSNDPNQQQLAAYKSYCENRIPEIANELKKAKLDLAVLSCYKPNKLEKMLINDLTAQYDIEYTYAKYDDYAKDYKVSDEELKEAYKTYKEFFKIDQEQRLISFIKVDLDPSNDDIKTGDANIAKIYNDFQSQEGILGLKNHKKEDNKIYDNVIIDSLMTNSKSNTLIALPTGASEPKNPNFMELLDGGIDNMKTIKPEKASDRYYYIYKVTKVVECPDSLGLNYVSIKGNKQMQDSVMNLLKNGMPIDSLKNNQNIKIQVFDKNSKQPVPDGVVYLQLPNKSVTSDNLVFQDSIREKIKSHLDGEFFLLDSNTQGEENVALYAQVVQYKAPITLYSVARVRYENEPSETTLNDFRKKLQAYIDKNKTAADFKKNAKEAKYEVYECAVDANFPYIGHKKIGPIIGTRELIYWAFNNKPGAVSQIIENEEQRYMVVAALEDVYKDYQPYNDPSVKEQLTSYILNKKIGKDLFNKYNGKAQDLDGYAKLLNSNVMPCPSLLNINDPIVIGRIIGMGQKAKDKIQVIAGQNALYVVKVNKIEQSAQPQPKEQIASFFSSLMGVNPESIISKSRKVYNNTLRFENPQQ